MKVINNDPVRYELDKTTVKRALFSKKEIVQCALGDENKQPLTDYLYSEIEPFNNGVATAHISPKQNHLLTLDGSQLVPELAKKYRVSMLPNGYIALAFGECIFQGLASKSGKIIVDPRKNTYMVSEGDTVIHGTFYPTMPNTGKLGVSIIDGENITEAIPQKYNAIKKLGDRIFALGRIDDTQTVTSSVHLKVQTTTSYQTAYAVFSIDKGLMTQQIFGDFEVIPGGYRAILYPNIRFDELSHSQSLGEAFVGKGKLNFKDAKIVVLDENFNIKE